MIRRLSRRLFKLALMVGAAAALYKVVQTRRPSPTLPDSAGSWKPVSDVPATPAMPASTPQTASQTDAAWVEPEGLTCPPTHPVKAKMVSLIYHLPGMAAYERTKPDRCYRDEQAAEADGLRKAKR